MSKRHSHEEPRAPGDVDTDQQLVDLWLFRHHERAYGGVTAQLLQRRAPRVLPTGQDEPGLRCAA